MDNDEYGTLRDLWDERVATRPDATFLVFEDLTGNVKQYTYGQFGTLIARASGMFRALGVRPGESVALHMHNCPELLIGMFGLTSIGAVCVPIHASNTAAECADIIGRIRARVVVCERDLAHLYGHGGMDVEQLVVARAGGAAHHGIDFEVALAAQPAVPAERAVVRSQDPAAIVFTSGTTAQPKGVVLTHANLIFSGRFVNWQAQMGPSDRLLTTMPACHVNFQLNALMPVLSAGATLIAIEKYSASRFWRQVCDYEATVVQAIAMMVRTMLMRPAAHWEQDNRVREVLYYLPITDEEKYEFERRFAARILNSYGTSETLVGSITDPPHGDRRWPSIGKVGRGYEARIVDSTGRQVPVGVEGEIHIRGIRGVSVMLEYLDDPQATSAVFTPDGWFRTGDLGARDSDGWFYFADRRTHLIKRAGENVSPAEVEAVLAQHPQIVEAAVVGVCDPVHDQAVKAFVVPTRDSRVTPAHVQEFCRERLAAFKVPTVVVFVESLPTTGSFKVAKGALQ